MTAPPPAAPRLNRPRAWLIGGLSLVAVIVLVQLWIGWPVLLAPWTEFPPGLLAAVLGLGALSYLARALRVQTYFAPRLAGRFPTTLRLSVLHTTANVILPMRLGEGMFPWLMRRYFGYGLIDAGVSLLWIRLLDLHVLMLTALVILWLREPSWSWSLLVLGWLAVLSLVARQHLAELYAWTLLCWGAKFIAFALVLGHFLPIDFWQRLSGVMGAELSSVLPLHGIGGSGSYEAAALAVLIPLGIEAKTALAAVVNLHLLMLGSSLLYGLLALGLPVNHKSH